MSVIYSGQACDTLARKRNTALVLRFVFEFIFFEEKKILELVGCFDSSASVEHTNLMIIIYVHVCSN